MESETENSRVTALSVLRSNALIIILVFVSMFLAMLPIVRNVLLPFEYFTTFIHEGSHTIASLLMGESVNRIVINPDTSGYMQHSSGGGVWSRGFIGSAGYVGAALFGGALIVWSSYKNMAKILLFSIGIIFLVAIVLYVRDLFSLAVCGLLSAALLLIAAKGSAYLNYFAINFLAAQCALNSFGDVMTVVKISLGAPKSAYSLGVSDADAVAQVFFLPAIFWSLLWMVISCVVLYYAMKKSAQIRAQIAD